MDHYINFIIMGAVGVFAIVFGIWFHFKMTEKQRTAKKAAKAREKAARLAAKRAANGEDFDEEFLETQDNSLPDDSDGEFKDTNLFGMKRKGDGPNVYQDWD